MQVKTVLVAVLGIASAIMLGAVFFTPLQRLAYSLFIMAGPSFVYWALLGALILGVVTLAGKHDSTVYGYPVFSIIIALTVLMAVFVGPAVSGLYGTLYWSDQVQSNAESLDTLPDTSNESVRVLPRSVADEYAKSSMQAPKYKTTKSDITNVNGSYVWSYGRVPNNGFVTWLGNQQGAMYVNMEQSNKNISISETEFKNGRGQLLLDSYRYQSVLHSPLRMHKWGTTFNGVHDETEFIAHSTVRHEVRFRWTPLPQPYVVPKHATVEVMYTNGTTVSLTPEEAQQAEILKGENYYPYKLTMLKVRSMNFRNGVWNRYTDKDDVFKIADLPESGNSWPIVVPTDNAGTTELSYFVAAQPTGSGSGVFEVWVIDSQTGEMKVQRYDKAQIGPQKAINYVSNQPRVNRLSDANVVSPVPIVKDGVLYWHAKVVPRSESGVLYTAFVNAKTGDVTLLDEDKKVYAFLSQSEFEQVKNNSTPKSSGTTVTVVVTDESGNIMKTTNVTVPEGGSVGVTVSDSGNSTNSSQQPAD